MPASGDLRVLAASTIAFTVCFAVWMMFGVTGIPIRAQLGLDSTQFGLLSATPILTGALFRLPLGIWTDRYGGRRIMVLVLVGCAIPVFVSAYATAFWQLLLLGLALGLVGATFSVGTPYVARFFSRERRGFAMGVFGAGTVGAALNMFVAPALIDAYGWQSVPKVYAAALLVTAVLFWLLSKPDPARTNPAAPSVMRQLAVLRDPHVWKYCQYYSIVFGALLDVCGISSTCFMLLYGIVSVSLALNYLTEVRRAPVMGEAVPAPE
jgi:NNP family nitrate/nitrite transporter-like MFS transporter